MAWYSGCDQTIARSDLIARRRELEDENELVAQREQNIVEKVQICIVPKKFLIKYPLKNGAIFYGILMICVMVGCAIGLSVEASNLSYCSDCTSSVTGFSITALVYTVIMIFVHLWFLWGVKNLKTSVVISWVVITTMWMAQVYCLVIVLLCIFIKESKPISWLILALIVLVIPLYGLLVGYGFWKELKNSRRSLESVK